MQEPDRKAKADLLHLASTWRQVAANYEYVEKLENFLNEHKVPDLAVVLTLSATIAAINS